MNRHFNLYYLHWWSLTHFLMHYENARCKAALGRLIADGGGLSAFDKHIGPTVTIETQWYGYLAELQRQTSRSTPPVRLEAVKTPPHPQAEFRRFSLAAPLVCRYHHACNSEHDNVSGPGPLRGWTWAQDKRTVAGCECNRSKRAEGDAGRRKCS
jgi:hypothetical protein